MMELSQAPAFVAAKMALLSDARAAAATRADELTARISDVRDRLNGRVRREGDDPAKLRIELDRLPPRDVPVKRLLIKRGHWPNFRSWGELDAPGWQE